MATNRAMAEEKSSKLRANTFRPVPKRLALTLLTQRLISAVGAGFSGQSQERLGSLRILLLVARSGGKPVVTFPDRARFFVGHAIERKTGDHFS
jgi:hypothetical protein